MNFLSKFVLFGLLFCYANCVVIDSKQGSLEGEILQSRGGRPFYAFYGIPYAEPPTGDLRYQNPVPAKSWSGVRNAKILPPPCISFENDGTVVGEEDCLYLNLYTPNLNKDASLPVMVFIYGGRFMYGDALPKSYGAHYFMDKDVVIITFHYRLGVLGFLSTEDEVIPGNYGLKDAVAVLQWVQDYVNSFGGDKNRVTIFGGSSGGVSAGLILIAPSAKGLFHRVISQSGIELGVEEFGVARRSALKIGSLLGCEHPITSQSLLLCLKKIPAKEIVKINLKLYTFGFLAPKLPWGPVVESEKVPGAFLIDQPRKLYQRKSDIPWLIGINSGDGAMLTIFTYFNPLGKVIHEIEKNHHKYLPLTTSYGHFTDDPKKLNEVTDTIVKHYFENSKISENPLGFSKMQTEIEFLLKVNETASLYNGPLYVYYYDHRNEETFAHVYGDFEEDMGVIHGDELISMFNWSDIITPVTKGVDLIVSEQVLELWTNFAAKGNPNRDDEIIWKPVEKPKINYLHIKDGSLKQGDHLLKEELEFLQRVKTSFSH